MLRKGHCWQMGKQRLWWREKSAEAHVVDQHAPLALPFSSRWGVPGCRWQFHCDKARPLGGAVMSQGRKGVSLHWPGPLPAAGMLEHPGWMQSLHVNLKCLTLYTCTYTPTGHAMRKKRRISPFQRAANLRLARRSNISVCVCIYSRISVNGNHFNRAAGKVAFVVRLHKKKTFGKRN